MNNHPPLQSARNNLRPGSIEEGGLILSWRRGEAARGEEAAREGVTAKRVLVARGYGRG